MRHHVKAWGHPTLPDLDYETEDLNDDTRYREYPMLSVALLTTIPYSMIEAALNAQQDKP